MSKGIKSGKQVMSHVINLERLMETIKYSNKVGQIDETGIRRLALTIEDKIMRDLFTIWLEKEELEIRVDDFGNIYGRRKGLRNDLSPVMTGSHLDTQPYGGRYDGILGVLSGLEVIRSLNDNNIETLRPIEVVVWTNEEGNRFAPPTPSGSGGVTNIFTKEEIYESIDVNGHTFREELEKIGYLGDGVNRPIEIHSYVELHIEQAPVLDREDISIGIVTGDRGFNIIEITVKGETGHSSGPPMEVRKDALLKASEVIVCIHEMIKAYKSAMITIGKVNVAPGHNSHIPDNVNFIIQIAHDEEIILNDIMEMVKEKSTALVEKDGMEIEFDVRVGFPRAHFSKRIVKELEAVTQDLGYSTLHMLSGGGHDANNIASIAPTGMIFIPCKDGISHNVKEYVSEEHIEKGANVLLNTVLNLAQQEDSLD
ncbi:Zn-dependent hydrolase [Metabacillus halosaccharovorans]|uniref:Zn-dependent hydrolase n=1 Tax=Metabacillus halosaccharovorans TaxID=930124 RepID=UPI0034CDF613